MAGDGTDDAAVTAARSGTGLVRPSTSVRRARVAWALYGLMGVAYVVGL